MSSVTFLVSAVLTVCVLHAIDQNAVNASINKLDFSAQVDVMPSKPVNVGLELTKPMQSDTSITTKNAYQAKKNDGLLPTNQNASAKVLVKDSQAI